jgi:hypothetical protein
MDKDLAKLVALTSFRSAADLTHLIPLLREHCSEEEAHKFSTSIANASAEIFLQISQKVFALYPELSDEFDAKIQKYGRPF